MSRSVLGPLLISSLLACACEQQTRDAEPSSVPPRPAASSREKRRESPEETSPKGSPGTEKTLNAALGARAAEFKEKAPEAVKTKYAAGLQAVVDAKTVQQAVQVGQKAPGFRLKSQTGKEVDLSELLKRGPVILMWYRGGWCPYCNLTLRSMQKNLTAFRKRGAELVAISPELPDKTLSTSEKNALEFQVLSDPKNQVAESYRVVFELTKDVAELYEQKFQIQAWNGDDSNQLPLAATYVIAQDGTVTWAFLHADYRKRAEPTDVLRALDELNRRK